MLDVRLQSRVAGRKVSQVDLRFGREFLIQTHHLAQLMSNEDSRLCPYIRQSELFHLLQHQRLDIPVITELLEHLVEPGVLLQFFQGSTFPFLVMALGAVLSTEYIEPKKSGAVVFSQGFCKLKEVELLMFP